MREGYWDYMMRQLREMPEEKTMTMDDMWKKEIAEMQSSVHVLQLRVKTLTRMVQDLNKKITLLGGDPRQLELDV